MEEVLFMNSKHKSPDQSQLKASDLPMSGQSEIRTGNSKFRISGKIRPVTGVCQ